MGTLKIQLVKTMPIFFLVYSNRKGYIKQLFNWSGH